MKKISAFDLTRLRIEEDFAFHQRIQQYAQDLPTTGALIAEGLPETSVTYLTTGVNTHKSAVDGLDSALKVDATVPSAKRVTEADAARDFAWTGLYDYVKAMTAHPDASIPLLPRKRWLFWINTGIRQPNRNSRKVVSCIICCRN